MELEKPSTALDDNDQFRFRLRAAFQSSILGLTYTILQRGIPDIGAWQSQRKNTFVIFSLPKFLEFANLNGKARTINRYILELQNHGFTLIQKINFIRAAHPTLNSSSSLQDWIESWLQIKTKEFLLSRKALSKLYISLKNSPLSSSLSWNQDGYCIVVNNKEEVDKVCFRALDRFKFTRCLLQNKETFRHSFLTRSSPLSAWVILNHQDEERSRKYYQKKISRKQQQRKHQRLVSQKQYCEVKARVERHVHRLQQNTNKHLNTVQQNKLHSIVKLCQQIRDIMESKEKLFTERAIKTEHSQSS